MTNLWLYILTVVVYSSIVWWLVSVSGCKKWFKRSELLDNFKKAVFVIMIVCAPFNIGDGSKFTIAGNIVSEKTAISLFSFYQDGKEGAWAICALYQKTDKGEADSVFSIYQNSTSGSAEVPVGFVFYQKSKTCSFLGAGLAVYQESQENCSTGFFSLIQNRDGEMKFLNVWNGYRVIRFDV